MKAAWYSHNGEAVDVLKLGELPTPHAIQPQMGARSSPPELPYNRDKEMFDMRHAILQHHIPGPVGNLSVLEQGNPNGPAIVMSHSILSSSMMWAQQAELLATCGWRVLRADIRGHGGSQAGPAPYVMDDLVADTIAILDALHIERAHYVGLSLGAMSGFGLGVRHPERVLSLLLCDGRADMPEAAGRAHRHRQAFSRHRGCHPGGRLCGLRPSHSNPQLPAQH